MNHLQKLKTPFKLTGFLYSSQLAGRQFFYYTKAYSFSEQKDQKPSTDPYKRNPDPVQTDTDNANASSEQTAKANQKIEDYYPIKRINFAKKDFYPIYIRDTSQNEKVSTGLRLAWTFKYFLGYSAYWLLFLDIHYWPHWVVMAALLQLGVNTLLTDRAHRISRILTLWINKDGKTFMVELPRVSSLEEVHDKSLPVPSDASNKNSFFFKGTLGKDLKIKYLRTVGEIAADNRKESGKPELKPIKKEEKKETGRVLRNYVIVEYAANEGLYNFVADLSVNLNNGYNDYLEAICDNKRVVMKESKSA